MKFKQSINNEYDFLKYYIPILKDISTDSEKKRWCMQYNVYQKTLGDKWGLEEKLREFMKMAYDTGLVQTNYSDIYDTIGNESLYTQKASQTEMDKLSKTQLISIIAKEFRHDHFCEGCLINNYIANGIMVHYMEQILKRHMEDDLDYKKILSRYKYASDSHIKKRIKLSDGVDAQENQDIINKIFLWKTNRLPQIDDKIIRDIRALNFNNPTEAAGSDIIIDIIKRLLSCKGVRIAVASTILKMFHPDIFPIIDQRSNFVIYNKDFPLYSSKDAKEKYAKLYSKYILKCAEFQKFNCPDIKFENIDKLLYQIDIENGHKIKY